jgi:hypothetical protein
MLNNTVMNMSMRISIIILVLCIASCSRASHTDNAIGDPLVRFPLRMPYDSIDHRIRSIPGIQLTREMRDISGSDTVSRDFPARRSLDSLGYLSYTGGSYLGRQIAAGAFRFVDDTLIHASLSFFRGDAPNTADTLSRIADELRRQHPPFSDSTPAARRQSTIDNFVHDNDVAGLAANSLSSRTWMSRVGGTEVQVYVRLTKDSTIWIDYLDYDRMLERFGHMRRIFTPSE